MLNALFGVAYGLETPFFPHLAAPNVAPTTELYRNLYRTLHEFNPKKPSSAMPLQRALQLAPTRLGPFGPVGGFRLAMVSRFWPSHGRSGTDRSTGGRPRSISGLLLRTSEARRFGGAEPGSRVGEQNANGRSKTELRGVSREK